MNVPVGLGVRYELNSVLNLRAEFVYRVLFTDYLDDGHNLYRPDIISQLFHRQTHQRVFAE